MINIQAILDGPDPESRFEFAPIPIAWEFRDDGLWLYGNLKTESYEINDECTELIIETEENGSIQTLKTDIEVLREDIFAQSVLISGGERFILVRF